MGRRFEQIEAVMVEHRYISTAQLAEAVGVSVTTVKRWVDRGLLPAHRTPGGHRKLPLVEVLRVLREGSFPEVDLSRLDLPARGQKTAEPRMLAEQLLPALRGRDISAARLIFQEAHQGGMPMATLADEVVAPIMTRLGHEWEKGKIDVYQEHRGTQVCMTALCALKTRLESSASGRPLAVGGGPGGDPYLLANLLAEMVLLEDGWEVINIGPNTPLSSFGRALSELRPRLMWLSVSYLSDPETFIGEYPRLYEQAQRTGTAVALGGRALTESMRVNLPYTTHGDRMAHLAAFARSLQPRPTRRPRGRPR